MAKATKFEKGDSVIVELDDKAVPAGVMEVKSGWVTIMLQDGSERKVRPSALTLDRDIEDEEPAEVETLKVGTNTVTIDVPDPTDATEAAPEMNGGVNELELDDDELEEDEDDEEVGNAMALTIKQFSGNYSKHTLACGKVSINNGDGVATLLAPLDHDDVMQLADQFCELGIGFCSGKYAHLNNGQKRMNSGNRIRAKVKKSPESFAVLQEIAAVLFTLTPESEEPMDQGDEADEADEADEVSTLSAEELAIIAADGDEEAA